MRTGLIKLSTEAVGKPDIKIVEKIHSGSRQCWLTQQRERNRSLERRSDDDEEEEEWWWEGEGREEKRTTPPRGEVKAKPN
jgi:hypothetical protein